MANPQNKTLGRWYEPVAGGLQVIDDKIKLDKADDEAECDVITAIQALSDTARTRLAGEKGLSLVEYDRELELDLWILLDRIDTCGYGTRNVIVEVADGAWFTPIAVDALSLCGETGGDVAANAIDGTNSTFWEHQADHAHSIVFNLRGHPKPISKIRFLKTSNGPLGEQLSRLTIRAAKDLDKIDDLGSLLEPSLDIVWPTGQGDVIHTLRKKKKDARWIKLTGFGSADPSNTVRITEFAVWVEPRALDDQF